jgi:hypothetical protein
VETPELKWSLDDLDPNRIPTVPGFKDLFKESGFWWKIDVFLFLDPR